MSSNADPMLSTAIQCDPTHPTLSTLSMLPYLCSVNAIHRNHWIHWNRVPLIATPITLINALRLLMFASDDKSSVWFDSILWLFDTLLSTDSLNRLMSSQVMLPICVLSLTLCHLIWYNCLAFVDRRLSHQLIAGTDGTTGSSWPLPSPQGSDCEYRHRVGHRNEQNDHNEPLGHYVCDQTQAKE